MEVKTHLTSSLVWLGGAVWSKDCHPKGWIGQVQSFYCYRNHIHHVRIYSITEFSGGDYGCLTQSFTLFLDQSCLLCHRVFTSTQRSTFPLTSHAFYFLYLHTSIKRWLKFGSGVLLDFPCPSILQCRKSNNALISTLTVWRNPKLVGLSNMFPCTVICIYFFFFWVFWVWMVGGEGGQQMVDMCVGMNL